ncbi:MAG: hypothetical protein QOJ97_2633 [Solirubrobacteraceae bacterium]|jgi:hypothetical protein|nr:hypothetical protein [Solirubrobacteraceae bacterium]
MDDQAHLAEHIESIATRTDSASERLATALLHCAWPGGSADRSEPAGLEWVRRWGPATMASGALTCSCAQGRCALCN